MNSEYIRINFEKIIINFTFFWFFDLPECKIITDCNGWYDTRRVSKAVLKRVSRKLYTRAVV